MNCMHGCVENKKKLQHWFFTSDLTFFIRGGRVSKAAGFFGGMLGICPLLNVDYEGHRHEKNLAEEKGDSAHRSEDGRKCRGRSGIFKLMLYHQSECMDDAKAVAMLVESRFPNLNGKVGNLSNWC